jgi:hypothetical protein
MLGGSVPHPRPLSKGEGCQHAKCISVRLKAVHQCILILLPFLILSFRWDFYEFPQRPEARAAVDGRETDIRFRLLSSLSFCLDAKRNKKIKAVE